LLTDEELLLLLRSGEADRVERKENAHSLDRIREAICAFANDLPDHRLPGVVFVGVRDDGSCAGTRIDARLLETLGGMARDGRILPFPTMSVYRRSLDACDVAVIVVQPSHNPPVKVDGRCWIRVGPRRAQATAEEERRLIEKRRWGSLPFDAQPVVGAALSDLDLKRFQLEYLPSAVSPETLAENARATEQQLAALRMVSRDWTPTLVGLLVLGIEPRQWVPGAYIQFRRVAGPELIDDTVDHEEIGGTVLDQVRRAEEVLDVHIQQPLALTPTVHSERPTYPIEALRQFVRNAVLHRTYEGSTAPVRITWFSDRLEIQSPGGPYGQVTAESFGQPGVTDYRNPTLAAAMKDLGLIERFGVGIGLARRSLRRNGNPEPEFTITPTNVLVTVRPLP